MLQLALQLFHLLLRLLQGLLQQQTALGKQVGGVRQLRGVLADGGVRLRILGGAGLLAQALEQLGDQLLLLLGHTAILS